MYTRSADLYDAIYAFKDYAAEARRLRELIEPVRRGAVATLLDVARGTGGHIPFLGDHYLVEGLDLSPRMLDVARRRNPGPVFHRADMTSFELDRRYDAVVCLFSGIGYVGTLPKLHQAIVAFARHLKPGGVVVVEPWKTPDTWIDGHISTLTVDQPELKIARMCVSERQGTRSIMEMRHLVATPAGVDYFTERHEMGLFTHDDYLAAFATAGLATSFDQDGLMGAGCMSGCGREGGEWRFARGTGTSHPGGHHRPSSGINPRAKFTNHPEGC